MVKCHFCQPPVTLPVKNRKLFAVRTLESHKATVHKVTRVPNQFICESCNKVIFSLELIQVHLIEYCYWKNLVLIHNSGLYRKLYHNTYSFNFRNSNMTFFQEFVRKAHLEKHLVSKSCLKNCEVSCLYCFKGFRTPSKLKIHVKKLNYNKRYKCAQCESYFRYENELLSHFDDVHKND